MERKGGRMKSDLHGCELADAKLKLFEDLEECVLIGDPTIEIVHGFHQGKVLRNYIRSVVFIRDMQRAGFKLTRECMQKNPGATIFRVQAIA